jgi:Mrp family chromosome partitioning ATPase
VLHQYLSVPNAGGLADVLAKSDVPWSAAIEAVALDGFVEPAAAAARPGDDTHCVSKFLCLTGGASVKNPKGILQSERLLDVLSDLQRISNYVIVDGPSLLDQAEVTPLGLIALGARGQQHVAEPHIAQPRHLIPEEGRYN